MSLRSIARLFELLDEKYPPDGGFRHEVQPSKEGNVLQITVRRAGVWERLEVEEADLDRPVEDVVADIAAIFSKRDNEP